MKIAELIKNKRAELNESQEEFGKRFNLSHAAISDLERGKTKSIEEDMLNFILPVAFYGKSETEVRAEEYEEIIKRLEVMKLKEIGSKSQKDQIWGINHGLNKAVSFIKAKYLKNEKEDK